MCNKCSLSTTRGQIVTCKAVRTRTCFSTKISRDEEQKATKRCRILSMKYEWEASIGIIARVAAWLA
jgi:hypothetical protein